MRATKCKKGFMRGEKIKLSALLLFLLCLGLVSCSTERAPTVPEDRDTGLITILSHVWHESSPPVDPLNTTGPLIPMDAFTDSFCWFNPWIEVQEHLMTRRSDLNPALPGRYDEFLPSLFLKTFSALDEEWCGIMRGFPGGLEMPASSILEIWINDFQPDSILRTGILHIDFGWIDEDYFEHDSNELNNELDEHVGIWTLTHDTGFRTAANSYQGESCEYSQDLRAGYDPGLDIIAGINCRRGNGLLDTEDSNDSWRLDEDNGYYSFSIPLKSLAVIDVPYDYADETDYWSDPVNRMKAWRLYRLPISQAAVVGRDISPPLLDNIQHMRIWIEGMGSVEGLRGQVVEITQLRILK